MLTYAKKRCLYDVTFQYFIYFCAEHSHGISPTLERWEDNFIGPWATLNFYLPMGELSQMEGLKFFTFFLGGITAFFPYGRMVGSPSLTGHKLTHLSPTRNSLPVDSQSLIYTKPTFHETLTKIFFLQKLEKV